jgi:DNA-binding protein HU-beta
MAASTRKVDMPDTRMSKAQFVEIMANQSGLTDAQVASALEALRTVVAQQLGKDGPGEVVIPGLLKLVVVEKPATEEHEGVNPFTKERMTYEARPRRKVIRAKPLKALNDAI